MATLTPDSPIEELRAAIATGWPRSKLKVDRHERAVPLPWINGMLPAIESDGWKRLDPMRNRVAEDESLCFCCGEPLRELSVMGRHRASFASGRSGRFAWITDGPAGHPRCLALAAAHCPHLREQHGGRDDIVIAFSWDRPDTLGYVETPLELVQLGEPRLLVRPEAVPLTLAELRALASRDPVGDG